ncbi:MAG: Lrp/AsnC ligand binding domain-containing protein [Candidatus Bathyarchaeia archaeon]
MISEPYCAKDKKMPSAIILLSTAAGTEKAILHCLRKQDYVQEAYPVQSAYDIVVRVKAETFDKLSAIISTIKNLFPKPQSVTTMVIVEGQPAH